MGTTFKVALYPDWEFYKFIVMVKDVLPDGTDSTVQYQCFAARHDSGALMYVHGPDADAVADVMCEQVNAINAGRM